MIYNEASITFPREHFAQFWSIFNRHPLADHVVFDAELTKSDPELSKSDLFMVAVKVPANLATDHELQRALDYSAERAAIPDS